MSMITFGSVTMRHGLALAPLAGVSDRAFRRVCRRYGAEYAVTEMVSAKALCLEQITRRSGAAAHVRPISGILASILPDEQPSAVQLFGHEPDVMAEAARLLESGCYNGAEGKVVPAAIDINMGCPVHKIVANGEGSALTKDPRLAGEIVNAVVKAVRLPVTVKIRAGWDADHINAPELAKILEANGASMICIHGRTKAQGYEPGVDRAVIRAVKQAVSVPVLGNGDIYTPEDAVSMMRETGCDGVMIARGAMGRPWLFAETIAALGGAPFVPPTPHERFDVALAQVREMIAEKGERVGLAEAKKHLAWYCCGLDGAAGCRVQIMQSETLKEMESAVRLLADSQDGRLRELPPRKERGNGNENDVL